MAVCIPCRSEHEPADCVDVVAGRSYPHRVCVCQHKPRSTPAECCQRATVGVVASDFPPGDHESDCAFWDAHCAGCQIELEVAGTDRNRCDLCLACARELNRTDQAEQGALTEQVS